MQESILKFFQSMASPAWDIIFEVITFLGEQYVTIAIVSWIYWNFSKKDGIIFTLIYMLSAFFNLFLKILFHTKRPFMVLDYIEGKRIHTATGYSFPSGHTQGAATLYFGLAHLIQKKSFWYLASILAVLVAVSRLYLGVHWPVDVLFGLVFGFLFPFLLFDFLRKQYTNKENFNTLLIKLLVIVYTLTWLLSAYNFFLYGNKLEFADMFKIVGVLTGAITGYLIQEKKLTFAVEANFSYKIIRYLLGLLTSVGLLIGLKFLLPENNWFNYLRYLIVGFWISGLFPMLGVKFKLFKLEK